jgi:hypothetical protein
MRKSLIRFLLKGNRCWNERIDLLLSLPCCRDQWEELTRQSLVSTRTHVSYTYFILILDIPCFLPLERHLYWNGIFIYGLEFRNEAYTPVDELGNSTGNSKNKETETRN